ncbi:putative disease resistance protein [Ananas comosus]|uniref:Putative disease resistance protein n=1 Tax=Ananas comosus TaxID=4615 RepID=A0A199V665_ANACO|nr:putative disease resistance protein [Ananas comosus]
MPPLMNDLARFVSMDECSGIESSGEAWGLSGSPRHLSLIFHGLNQSKHANLMNLKGLRTLMFLDASETVSSYTLSELESLKSLRVLDLRNTSLEQLPPSIKELKHLRYLNLSDNPIQELPSSLCVLHNLQTLVLLRCRSLVKLPEKMYELTNLRHLEADKSLTSKIESIGRLSLLQELEEFKVFRNHRIGELKEMNELRGCLSIGDLHNVESGIEAGEAMLANKCRLEMLELEWPEREASSINTSRDLEVLENFQPPSSLRTLKITQYGGISTPKWMKDKTLSHLEVVRLYDCPKWEQLPSLGSLRFLKTLEVRGMPGVSTFSHDFYGDSITVKFPSLRMLRFANMPEWKDWLVGENDQYSFPCLDELALEKCTNLRKMPPLPPALRKITLEGVGLQDLQKMKDSFYDSLQQPSSTCYSLNISNCLNLKRLHEGFLHLHLRTSITSLTISGCTDLSEQLPKECFRDFASLKTLQLKECPKLRVARESGIPLSLEELEIISCPLVMNQSVCMALQNDGSVPFSFVISNGYNGYNNFEYFFSNVLPHLTKFQSLHIGYESSSSASSFGISMKYEGSRQNDFYRCLEMKIRIDLLPECVKPRLSDWLRGLKSLPLLSISGGPTVEYPSAEVLQSLSSLRKLVIEECGRLDSLSLQSLSSLKSLMIRNCPSLVVCSPRGLSSLSITHLDIINSSTFIDLLQELRALKCLKICSCPGLTSFAGGKGALVKLNCLQELEIDNCVDLHSLPADLHELKSLVYLRISRCPKLECLPDSIPYSLESLSIIHCSQLKDRCRKNDGQDWHKIAHIRNLLIEWQCLRVWRWRPMISAVELANKSDGGRSLTDRGSRGWQQALAVRDGHRLQSRQVSERFLLARCDVGVGLGDRKGEQFTSLQLGEERCSHNARASYDLESFNRRRKCGRKFCRGCILGEKPIIHLTYSYDAENHHKGWQKPSYNALSRKHN